MNVAKKSPGFPCSREDLKKLRDKAVLAKQGKIRTRSTADLMLACMKQSARKPRAA
jgi:hypothetical protein